QGPASIIPLATDGSGTARGGFAGLACRGKISLTKTMVVRESPFDDPLLPEVPSDFQRVAPSATVIPMCRFSPLVAPLRCPMPRLERSRQLYVWNWFVISIVLVGASGLHAGETALDRYVAKADPTFS